MWPDTAVVHIKRLRRTLAKSNINNRSQLIIHERTQVVNMYNIYTLVYIRATRVPSDTTKVQDT